MTKNNFSWKWSQLFSISDMIQKVCIMERWKINTMEFDLCEDRWKVSQISNKYKFIFVNDIV